MKYDFMRCNANQFSLAGMCRALSASRSGYYAWRDRDLENDLEKVPGSFSSAMRHNKKARPLGGLWE